ncbi:MAG: YbbR-like domain-containing protein [Bacteroidaceae bacterium]|nr:YbbR-like domain-containing protein [Bacteroidaceae bacterium]
MDNGTQGERKKKRFLGKRTKDILIFLFFVLICTVFWFVRELEETFSMEVIVPVRLNDVPEGVIITTDVPEELKLTIHDKGVELVPLMMHNHTDTLEISFKSYDNHEPTGHGVLLLSQLQASLKRLIPSTSAISNMSPDTVYFYYNRGVHRRLPVRTLGVVEAEPQYCISEQHFTPDSVDIYAPASILDTMKAAYTERLNLTGLSKSSSHKVRLRTRRGMRIFPDSVTLSTEVDILTRQTVEVPITGVNFPADKTLRTFPSTVKITYLVAERKAHSIDPSNFVVVVTYADLIEHDESRCRPRLTNVPEGVSGALVDPIEVDYLLENVVTEEPDAKTKKKPTKRKKR